MESGLNARAVDFGRFGRLFLKGGVSNGRQVVPRGWVETATRPILGSPARHYGYVWWLDGERPGRFFAAGNLGQYIYIAPDRDAVVVRFGERFGGLDSNAWVVALRGVADDLSGKPASSSAPGATG
jgi:CubicO group peptidase (beta-lactamase class C family)